jgi:hypothetical protein
LTSDTAPPFGVYGELARKVRLNLICNTASVLC